MSGSGNKLFSGASCVSNSQSSKEDYLDVEYDTVKRYAKVSVYSRTVEGLSSIHSSSSSSGPGSAHHWVLLVHFEDDSFRHLEGNQDDNGILQAHYLKYKCQGMLKLKDLGEVLISPWKLRLIAKNNHLNGTRYDLLSNNCQNWVIRAAKDISPDIGKKAESIDRIAPILSGMLYIFAFVALFGIIALPVARGNT